MKTFTGGLTASRLEHMLAPYMEPDHRPDEQSDWRAASDAGKDRHEFRAIEANPSNGSASGSSSGISD